MCSIDPSHTLCDLPLGVTGQRGNASQTTNDKIRAVGLPLGVTGQKPDQFGTELSVRNSFLSNSGQMIRQHDRTALREKRSGDVATSVHKHEVDT